MGKSVGPPWVGGAGKYWWPVADSLNPMEPTHEQSRRNGRDRRPRRLWAALGCGLLAFACLSGPIRPESPEPVPANAEEAALQVQLRRSLPPGTHLGGTFSDAI